MPEVCQICDYSLNMTIRKKVCCPYCGFDACRKCCETYVLGETLFKCMNTQCTREWNRPFISSAFTNSFITGKLKNKREELLFDIEKALLPSTQPQVERIIKKEVLTKQYYDVRKKMNELKEESAKIQNELYRLDHNRPVANTERVEFVKACPNSDCRGFLSSQWKCGLCQLWACQHCHEIKGNTREAEHTCDPDTVASVGLLSNDTKPCPNCRTRIFKISGCPQMFCTNCNTGFNWNTGRVETVVHNPHYFEWLRRNGNQVNNQTGDIPCNAQLTHTSYQTIRTKLTNKHAANQFSRVCDVFVSTLVRNTLHMRYIIMDRYAHSNRILRNEQLRVRYLRNQITDTEFKLLLQRNEKKEEKKREIHNVLDILLNTITDIVFRFDAHLNQAPPGEWTFDILEEIDPIVNYANECLIETSKVYNSRRLKFSNEMAER